MTKHDYIHRFMEMNEMLRMAKVHCDQPAVLDYIEKIKGLLWLIADDMAIDLTKEGRNV